jgi:uncharacterized protein
MGRFQAWRVGLCARWVLAVLLGFGCQADAWGPASGVSGILFEIRPAQSQDTRPPSYLLGTIHSDDPRVLALPAAIRAAFDSSPGIALELIPDADSAGEALAAMTDGDGRTLRQALPPDLYRASAAALQVRGLDEPVYRYLKPWAVAVLLGLPSARTGEFLDQRLYRQAIAARKRVLGLETMAEQMAIFDGLDGCDGVALLRDTLVGLDRLPGLHESLIRAWLAHDLDRTMREGERAMAEGDERIALLFWESAVDSRNRRLADRMAPLLDQGGWFVAVGALHLPSPDGILRLLERRGYRVTALD